MNPIAGNFNFSTWLSLRRTIATKIILTLSELKTVKSWLVFKEESNGPGSFRLRLGVLSSSVAILVLASTWYFYFRKTPSHQLLTNNNVPLGQNSLSVIGSFSNDEEKFQNVRDEMKEREASPSSQSKNDSEVVDVKKEDPKILIEAAKFDEVSSVSQEFLPPATHPGPEIEVVKEPEKMKAADVSPVNIRSQELSPKPAKKELKRSAASFSELSELQQILQEKNFYSMTGPLVEAIQLYVEELRLACQNDIMNSERYLPQALCQKIEKQRSNGLHPHDEIFLCIKAVRSKIGKYLEGESFDNLRDSMRGSVLFDNPLFLLQTLIAYQPQQSRPAMKKKIDDRIERLSKLLKVLTLVDKLRQTEAGIDALSQPINCKLSLERSNQLIETVEKWYAVLDEDLKPNYALWFLRNEGDLSRKKETESFCIFLQEGFQNSKHQFIDWKNRAGSWTELDVITKGLRDYIHFSFKTLKRDHPCHKPFLGHLAITNSATALLKAQENIVNVMEFERGVRWLMEGGFSDLDNALEGVLSLSELLIILTSLPRAIANTKKRNQHSCFGLLSEVVIQHWHNNQEVIIARESIKKMRQQSAVPTALDVEGFRTILSNLAKSITETGLVARLTTILPLKKSEQMREIEDPLGLDFGFVDYYLQFYINQAIQQLVEVARDLESDPSFNLKQMSDHPSPGLDQPRKKPTGKKRLNASKKGQKVPPKSSKPFVSQASKKSVLSNSPYAKRPKNHLINQVE